jgi:hypothetical protein
MGDLCVPNQVTALAPALEEGPLAEDLLEQKIKIAATSKRMLLLLRGEAVTDSHQSKRSLDKQLYVGPVPRKSKS